MYLSNNLTYEKKVKIDKEQLLLQGIIEDKQPAVKEKKKPGPKPKKDIVNLSVKLGASDTQTENE